MFSYLKRVLVILTVLATIMLGIGVASANADYSTDPANPTLVTTVPEGFSPYGEPTTETDNCVTTTTQAYSRTTPGEDAVTHEEWRTEERTRSSEEVTDYVTEYHFRKFVRTKTRTYTEGTAKVDHWWNWSPNNSQGPQNYVPNFPNDPRGTWQGPHVNGGPQQDTYGTFQTGGGNSPFFHRENVQPATQGGWGPWSAFGPWTPWVPESHTSWETSTAPLGVPQFHGSGQNGNTQFYREWQAQFDGQTREVASGTHTEYGEWSPWRVYGEPSLTEPVLPANTDTHEYRFTGPVVVVDVPSSDDVTHYVYTVTVTGEPCEEPTPTPTPEPTEPVTPNEPTEPTEPDEPDQGIGTPVTQDAPVEPVKPESTVPVVINGGL